MVKKRFLLYFFSLFLNQEIYSQNTFLGFYYSPFISETDYPDNKFYILNSTNPSYFDRKKPNYPISDHFFGLIGGLIINDINFIIFGFHKSKRGQRTIKWRIPEQDEKVYYFSTILEYGEDVFFKYRRIMRLNKRNSIGI